MDYLKIVNIAYIALIGLFVVIEIFVGLSRGGFRSMVRLVFVLLSAVVAVILTNYAMGQYGDTIYNAVNDNLGITDKMGEQLAELSAASPTLAEYLPALLLGVAAPLVFVLLFVALSLVTMILGAIVNAIFKKFANNKSSVSRFYGLIISILCAVVAVSCILMPVTGYLVNAGKVYTKLEEEEVIESSSEEGAKIAEALKNVDKQPVVAAEYYLTSFLFEMTTTYKVGNGAKSNIVADATAVAEVAPAIVNLGAMDFSNVENIDVTPLRSILTGIGKNEPIRAIIAEILSYASGKWLNYEEFMGLNLKEQLPEDVKDDLDPALEKLNATTYETVIDDLNDFIDEIEALSRAYDSVASFSANDFSEFSEVNVTPLNDVIDIIENTTIARKIVANLMKSAGEKWASGEEFINLNIEEQLPEDLKGVLKPAYELLATCDNENVITNLRAITALLDDVKNIVGDLQDFSEEKFDEENLDKVDLTSMRKVVNEIETSTSPLTKKIVASLVARASGKWLLSQEFMGINMKDQLPLEYREMLDGELLKLSNTTEETVIEDLNSLIDKMSTVISMYAAVKGIADGNVDLHESAGLLAKAFSTVTPSNVQTIEDVMEEAVKSVFDDESTSNAIAGMAKKVLRDISELNASDDPEVQAIVEKYADLVNEVLVYVYDAESDASADGIINYVLAHEDIGQTIASYVNSPEAEKVVLPEERKQEISSAVNTYLAEHEDISEANLNAINAVKRYFDID